MSVSSSIHNEDLDENLQNEELIDINSHNDTTQVQDNLNDERICKICRGDEEPLFSPCNCNSHVHQECLLEWVKSKNGDINNGLIDYDNIVCEICKSKIVFKRSYDTAEASNVGVVEILRLKFQSLQQNKNMCIQLGFVVLGLLVGTLNWFTIRKYYLYGEIPSLRKITAYFFDESSNFIFNDLYLVLQCCIVVFFEYQHILNHESSKKIVNHHLQKQEDEELPPIWPSGSDISGLQALLFFPILVPAAFIAVGYIPVKAVQTLAPTLNLQASSSLFLFYWIVSLMVALVPVKLFSTKDERLFTRLFFTKYTCKEMTLSFFDYLAPLVIVKPVLDICFGNKLLHLNNYTFDIRKIDMFSLYGNPYTSLLNTVKLALAFANSHFYRYGLFSLIYDFQIHNAADTDHIFLFNVFHNLITHIKRMIFLLGATMMLYGTSLMVLVSYRPDVLPLSIGYGNSSSPLNSGKRSNSMIIANLDKLLDLASPLFVKFVQFYYKFFALKLARWFRLSEFLFRKTNIDERGSIVYRSLYHQWFKATYAQLSNTTLFSEPKTMSETHQLFKEEPTVHAYFVPNGQYRRVPNFLPKDITCEYYTPVTKNDKPLRPPKAKLENEYTPFRQYTVMYYFTLYTPPFYVLRLWAFHVCMGALHGVTALYFFISSNFVGQLILNRLRFVPWVSKKIEFGNNISFIKVFLGLLIQLMVINSVVYKDLTGPAVLFRSVFKIFRFPFFLNITLFPGVVLAFLAAGFVSYETTSAFTLAFKWKFLGKNPWPNYYFSYLLMPMYLMTKHLFIYVIPVGIYLAWLCLKLLIKIQIEDLQFKEGMKAVWNDYYRMFVVGFLKYILPALLIQFSVSAIRHCKFHKWDYFLLQHSIAIDFFSSNDSLLEYLYVLLGPLLFFGGLGRDSYRFIKAKYAKTKTEAIDKLHADDIVLENKKEV